MGDILHWVVVVVVVVVGDGMVMVVYDGGGGIVTAATYSFSNFMSSLLSMVLNAYSASSGALRPE